MIKGSCLPSAGDMAPVRELLASSSAELQSQMLGSIVKADRKVLTRLAADLDCLRALDLWMIDLIPDTRAFQILEDILQVTCTDLNASSTPGLFWLRLLETHLRTPRELGAEQQMPLAKECPVQSLLGVDDILHDAQSMCVKAKQRSLHCRC